MNLDGKRILITGAASGIGRATTVELAATGARAALFDRAAVVTDLASSLAGTGTRARGWVVDVGDEAQVARAVREANAWLTGIDVLIHCAGIMRGQMLDVTKVTAGLWHDVLRTNLTGTFFIVKHVVAQMRGSPGSSVVLVGSEAGVVGGSGSYAYGASKGGLHGLALTLERHLSDRGIRVVEVLPGAVDTPLLRGSLVEAAQNAPSQWGGDPRAQPVRPASVAKVLLFLASDDGSHIVGTVRTR